MVDFRKSSFFSLYLQRHTKKEQQGPIQLLTIKENNMKQFLFISFAILLCFGMTSCKSNKEEEAKTISGILELAKKESNKWSIDDWKNNYKYVFQQSLLLNEKIQDLETKIHSDTPNAETYKKELKSIKDDVESAQKFIELVENDEKGKKIFDDEEFKKEIALIYSNPHREE